MRLIRCEKCGLALEQRGDQYICPGCGAKYAAESARRVADEMARLLDEQKQERVANLRQQLWKEFNEEFYNRAEISRLAKGILNILPDDFFAQFCDLATGKDMHRLNAFLYAADVKAQSVYIWDMFSFLLRPLREETLTAVNDLLSRAREAELDRERFNKYNERLAAEAQKLDAGVYDVTLPRDVFLAYSSADMAQVGELVEALEAQKISCFVAARNLQHGAIQNYEEQLRRAMDHCRTVVFVSSKNSRSRTCDALSTELPYIRERDIAAAPQYRNDYAGMPARYKKPRIEYLVDAHTHTAADAIVEEFFEGCEYCYDAATAAQRILGLLTSKPAAAVKYCRSCGTENPVRAKLCLECGGREFADTYAEYESKRHADTDSEIARLRAELEKLKKQAQEAAAKPAPQQMPAQHPKPAPSVPQKSAEELYTEGRKYFDNKDHHNALPLLQRAAGMGYAKAQTDLGYCYDKGYGVAQDYSEAVKWYRKAAEQGEIYAQNNLGESYYYGQGVAQDYSEAVKWYRKAAEQGYVDAQNNLGWCYQNGKGVVQDYAEAVKWYRKAAEQGNADAQSYLGDCYRNGYGVTQDYAEAVKWYRKAAEQGDADAQNNLGWCYENGYGVVKDYSEAVKWYRKAAEQGHATAQKNLGVCYRNGYGVTQDYAEAAKWYRKAAEQGNVDAQYNLGLCYENGRGVTKSIAVAIKWYEKAAEQGDEDAKANLARLKG